MSLRIDEIVGYHMKSFRLKRQLTQQALADRANLSKQTISNLEKGQGANSKTIERIAECLDVSPLAFYTEVKSGDDIQFKRVSSTSTIKGNHFSYMREIKVTIEKVISDTKDIIYYKQVSPAIKDTFQANQDFILSKLNAEKCNKNYHVLSALGENLISNIKQAIYEEEEEMDSLIEE